MHGSLPKRQNHSQKNAVFGYETSLLHRMVHLHFHMVEISFPKIQFQHPNIHLCAKFYDLKLTTDKKLCPQILDLSAAMLRKNFQKKKCGFPQIKCFINDHQSLLAIKFAAKKSKTLCAHSVVADRDLLYI